LGDVATEQGDFDFARRCYGESLNTNLELNDRLALAYLFESLGCLAALQGDPYRSLRLVAAAMSLREVIGAPLPPAEAARLEEKLAPARQQLSQGNQVAAEAEGRALSFDQAIDLAAHWTEN
jgi:hypothetical protein